MEACGWGGGGDGRLRRDGPLLEVVRTRVEVGKKKRSVLFSVTKFRLRIETQELENDYFVLCLMVVFRVSVLQVSRVLRILYIL